MIASLSAILLTATLGSGIAHAQEQPTQAATAAPAADEVSAECTYEDEDGDGVCDHAAAGVPCGGNPREGVVCDRAAAPCAGPPFVDEDGDGVCDLAPQGAAPFCGRRFVDEDGDGVCDQAPADLGRCGGPDRTTPCGRPLVDDDGDGILDPLEVPGGGHRRRGPGGGPCGALD